MKLLKFLFKYFLFRSTRKLKNIEAVICSHGFRIYPFCIEDAEDPITDLLTHNFNAKEFAKHHKVFIATNPIINGVFIKDGLSDDDQLDLLFHEEAHIWYNHPNVTSFTNETDTQQERTANLFLPRLRILKAVFYLLLASTLFIYILFVPTKNDTQPSATQETVTTPQANTDPIPDELEEVENAADKIKTVYITAHGDCYHQKACDQIAASDTVTPITITMAEQLGKRPCIT